jgi:hypothetical protein
MSERPILDAPAVGQRGLKSSATGAQIALASSRPLESNLLAEKEGFEPSLKARSTPGRHGIPSAEGRHG